MYLFSDDGHADMTRDMLLDIYEDIYLCATSIDQCMTIGLHLSDLQYHLSHNNTHFYQY